MSDQYTHCTVVMTVGYCRILLFVDWGSAVRMQYCFVVVRVSAVRVGSCNLVVGVRSGSILVGLPCRVLAAVLHRGCSMALKFGIPILFDGLLSRKWELGGFVSWKCR